MLCYGLHKNRERSVIASMLVLFFIIEQQNSWFLLFCYMMLSSFLLACIIWENDVIQQASGGVEKILD